MIILYCSEVIIMSSPGSTYINDDCVMFIDNVTILCQTLSTYSLDVRRSGLRPYCDLSVTVIGFIPCVTTVCGGPPRPVPPSRDIVALSPSLRHLLSGEIMFLCNDHYLVVGIIIHNTVESGVECRHT